MDTSYLVEGTSSYVHQFSKDSFRLLKRCNRPDRKEFLMVAMVTAAGFAIMGFVGYFVKLIHIPIINLLVGSK